MGRPRNLAPLADRLLDALRQSGRQCTRGELGAMYLPKAKAAQIQAALDELCGRGEVERVWVEDRRAWHGAWSAENGAGRWQRWEYRLAGSGD